MSRVQANLFLLAAAALWGAGYVPQKLVLSRLDPFSAIGLRCLIGAALLAPVLLRRPVVPWRDGELASLVRVAAPFAAGITLQQMAFLGASVTNAGFLVNTAAVMCPGAAFLLNGERPGAKTALAAGLSLAGALLLAGGLGRIGISDLVALGSAASYAVWTVELGRHARSYGAPMRTAVAQFLLTAAVTLPFGALQGGLTVERITAAAPDLVLLGIFSTAVAFALQTMALRVARAVDAAVIVSAESVFGAMVAAVALDERMSATACAGALLIVLAILLSSLPTGALRLRPAAA